MRRSLTGLTLAAIIVALLGATDAVAAGTWSKPVNKGSIEGDDLDGTRAKARVRDRVLKAGSKARAHAAAFDPQKVEEYVDDHGHKILVGTTLPLLDLQPVASVLAGVIHGGELNDLRTLVIPLADVPAACGATENSGVVGCYGADDPDRFTSGQIIIGLGDPDVVHTLVHEYGHHMDNQLLNLGHLGVCNFANDGSRRWFFARDADDNVFEDAGCGDNTPYERLLGELFAEDFAALNGISDWQLTEFLAPTARTSRALRQDIEEPFSPRSRVYSGQLGGYGTARWTRFRVDVPTFLSATLRGAGPGDLDLYLYRRGGRRPMERSIGRSSHEGVGRILPAGFYEIAVVSYAGRSRYRLRLGLD